VEEITLAARGNHTGHMVDRILAFHGVIERSSIVQVTPDHLDPLVSQSSRLARRTGQGRNCMPSLSKGLGQMASHEAGSPGYKRLHIARSYSR
jgi:hypothetical protein